jgi:tRNA threonylcarbamoyl adenosine modification protein YeaZ
VIILAIDCSASPCAACVYDSGRDAELGRCVVEIGKGHAEHLIGVIDRALAEAGLTLKQLDAIAVGIGPGSFTGIRVAVSAARGFALALAIPAVGIDTLEAIAAEARARHPGTAVLVALASLPDTVQAAVYDAFGQVLYAPRVMTVGEGAVMAQDTGALVVGTATAALEAVSRGEPAPAGWSAATADIAVYARLAAGRIGVAPPPVPLYLREPDAKPQAGFVLPRRVGP